MKEQPFVLVDAAGKVESVNDAAARLCGIPKAEFVGRMLSTRLIAEHRIRFTSELEAITDGAQQQGRVHCTLIGFDGIGRRLTINLSQADNDLIHLAPLPYQHPESSARAPGSSLSDTGRFLPVARRISGIARRAKNTEKLLLECLEVLAEVTAANSAAALEWGEEQQDRPLITVGPFDEHSLKGVFRPAILSRLNQGDVVVKELLPGGSDSDMCLIIVPLLSSTALTGIMVLTISGYSVLVPEEQQSLAILGEIMGLGLISLSTTKRRSMGLALHKGDRQADVALGRLTSGMAHEINNAVTVLRSNVEQFMMHGDGFSRGNIERAAIKDSLEALDVICDLNDALRAFAPDENTLLEETDLLRLLDMVVRSVRFYAKRGLNVTLDRPDDTIPNVEARSHYLIRCLSLIFVDLIEASLDSGLEPQVRFALNSGGNLVTLTINVAAGPVNLPSVLLRQLEKGGTLAVQVSAAGGDLSHNLDHEGSLSIAITLAEVKSPDKQAIPQEPPAPTRRGTILVVDDEGAVIRSLRRILQTDHDVLAARSGEEALKIIQSNPEIDIILYDISMPRLGPQEFYDVLQRLDSPSAERVVFVSGGATDGDVSSFLAKTANTVIEKPFDLPQLNDIIASMLL
jgi:CheY-like chemotaxis protein/signal transduction histidine kinase